MRDADNSGLQLVEMCEKEGVWSPLCDNEWTLQDATVVCRELGYTNLSMYNTDTCVCVCVCTRVCVYVCLQLTEQLLGMVPL